ncbi:MAG: N4-gp56 family major capsid protein [Patescibacteria group bacterium]|nr:N4-gp56 family major capsid protein [Patescibacteria group bacterium]
MANINYQATFNADVENYIQEKTLPLTQRQLVAYQFGDMLRLPKGRGLTYTASRYDRVNLPFAPLSEGVPPVGEALNLAQVTATAQQWGDTITITDVADMTIKHPLFQKAIELISMQMAETFERNTFNNLMAGTQVNYVNSRGARASLVAGDVLNPHEFNRAAAALYTIGAPQFNGQMEEDAKVQAGKPGKASESPRGHAHYVALIHPLPEQDMRENSTVVTAWSYSDINRLYNNELGEWAGIRFCRSNMVPSYVGVAAVSGTAGTAGSLATGTYYVQVTGSVAQSGYEQRIYQVSSGISVTGPTGSISVTVPTLAGYVFNVYVGTTTSPVNLGKTTSGPTSGPLAGQAVQIASGSTVVITAVGASQTPPAAPATGVTVYPTFIFGKSAYGQVQLDDPKFSYLKTADKSDPLNQLRVVGWKAMYGTIILNQNFFMRIESSSAFSSSFG